MTKPSQVNFQNNTDEPITVKPVGSSANRSWREFTLQPMEKQKIRDSAPVTDLEFEVYAKPSDGQEDVLLGRFAATNDWLEPASFTTLSRDIMKGVATKTGFGGKWYRTVYSGGYFKGKYMNVDEEKGIISRVEPDMFDDGQSKSDQESFWKAMPKRYTQKPLAAFADRTMPFAYHEYLGDGNGAKTWGFYLEDWSQMDMPALRNRRWPDHAAASSCAL